MLQVPIEVRSKPPTLNLTTYTPEVNSGQSYNLNWYAAVCADGYELQESVSYSMDDPTTYQIPDVKTNIRQFSHANLTGSVQKFFYRIRAVNNAMKVQGDWSNILRVEVDPSASGGAETPSSWMDENVLLVPKTATVPAIDGVLDPVWVNTAEVMQRYYTNNRAGWFDLWGSCRLMWDDTSLYGFMDVYDEHIVDSHANRWEQDGWELYFDADNSKGLSYDGLNDGQFRINHHDTSAGDIDVPAWFANKSDVVYKNRNKGNGLGWTLEWKIPLSSLKFAQPYNNRVFGWEAQQNDNDGTTREDRSKWWDISDESYQNASLFGTARLSDNTINENLDVWETATEPVIDGNLEDTWLPFPHCSDQTYCTSDSPDNFDQRTVSDWSDARFNFWAIWNSANLYIFVKAWDDTRVLTASSGNSWESDGIELFFDGNNSKGSAYDGADDNHLIIERKDTASGDIDSTLLFDRNIIYFANQETAYGWNLELSIPLNALCINPSTGTKFGFELQMNDNDGAGRDVIRRWWNWNDDSWQNPGLFGTAELVGSSGRIMSSGVYDEAGEPAAEYRLGQNYPNPFNASTTIDYVLKAAGRVRLSVCDLSGKEVAVLADAFQCAGNHTIHFSGLSLTSGIYVYRLRTANGIQSGKMMLIK